MIRILLVDDQNLIQEGIKALLDQHQDLKVIGTVKDGRNAIKLVKLLHPDIVLLDIEMPGMDGITVTRHISSVAPETKVIILTSYEDKKYIMQSLLAGAKGYLLKSSLMKDLKQAILAVDNGYCQLESRLLAKIFKSEKLKTQKSQPLSTVEIDENQQKKAQFVENSLGKERAIYSAKKINKLVTLQIPEDRQNNEQLIRNSSGEKQTISPARKTNNLTNEVNESLPDNSTVKIPENQPNEAQFVENSLGEESEISFDKTTNNSIEPDEPLTNYTVEIPENQPNEAQFVENSLGEEPEISFDKTMNNSVKPERPQNDSEKVIVDLQKSKSIVSSRSAQAYGMRDGSLVPSPPVCGVGYLYSSTVFNPVYFVLPRSQTQSSAIYDTIFSIPQTQTVITSNTLFTLPQDRLVDISNTLLTTSYKRPLENSSVKTFDVSEGGRLLSTNLKTDDTSLTLEQTQPTKTQSTETSVPNNTSTQNQQENISHSKVPLLPAVKQMALSMAEENYPSLEDDFEKPQKNNLTTQIFVLKKHFQELVSQKNISRYKTNISIIIFQYRLILRQYRAKISQYTKGKISRSSQTNQQSRIKLTHYRTKLGWLIKYWHEKGLFFNLGLMILGAAIFFLVHSIFNR